MDLYAQQMNLYYLLVLGINPILSCTPFSFGKRRLLFLGILLNIALLFLITRILQPLVFRDLFSGGEAADDFAFTTGYWLMFVLPLSIGLSCLWAGVIAIIKTFVGRRKSS